MLKIISQKNKFIHNLGIIDLSQSWDYTQELKDKFIEKQKLEQERAWKLQQELEERKQTPGYCCECGAAHADWVIDPYYYEMYGDKHWKWMCSDCYNDSAMSV